MIMGRVSHTYGDLRYFSRSEFNEPEKMCLKFLSKLDECRHKAGIPFVITSSYRNNQSSSHSTGKAVDIRCRHSNHRYKIIKALLKKFNRIGVYDCHIHVDADPERPVDVVWWGVSE